jgi:hypothetical protein
LLLFWDDPPTYKTDALYPIHFAESDNQITSH